MEEQETLSALRAENARLIALLEKHGIDWRLPAVPAPTPTKDETEHSQLSTDKKLALFRTLFRGRPDVFALRWENRKGEATTERGDGREVTASTTWTSLSGLLQRWLQCCPQSIHDGHQRFGDEFVLFEKRLPQ